jgi:chromosomal replication initiator protein
LGVANSHKNEGGESSDSTHEALWQIVSASLKLSLDPQIFEAYIKPLAPLSFDHATSELAIGAPSKFLVDRVERSYGEEINRTLTSQIGENAHVSFRLESSLIKQTKTVQAPIVLKKQPEKMAVPNQSASVGQTTSSSIISVESSPIQSNLNARYNFSNFVVGNSNQFCHAAARQVADAPGQTYNPLFIYGGVGLGKSHLLHAIGNSILERKPNAKVLYMSSESFTNELIQSLRTGKMEDFKRKLRELDVLLIDDIQFISGKERTQEEFFHTFNTLHSAKKQIVITSDTVPQDIIGLKERLQTRFSWGLIADLQVPDFETRVAIINRKASNENVVLPMDVAQYVADNISTNVRELEGALTRLCAVSSLQGVRITRQLAESVLKPMLKSKPANITVDDIKSAVSNHFGLKVADLSSKKRSRSYSFPRHIAMYLCRKHTTCSYPDIGDQFGGRDHSSVIHAANVVGKKITTDVEVKNIIGKIEGILTS